LARRPTQSSWHSISAKRTDASRRTSGQVLIDLMLFQMEPWHGQRFI